jgi:hypothetical protein
MVEATRMMGSEIARPIDIKKVSTACHAHLGEFPHDWRSPLATDAQIAKAPLFHLRLWQEITTVNDDGGMHQAGHFGIVEF